MPVYEIIKWDGSNFNEINEHLKKYCGYYCNHVRLDDIYLQIISHDCDVIDNIALNEYILLTFGNEPSRLNAEDLDKDYTILPKEYDHNFGDDIGCTCGHSYYRHFDSHENMRPTLCKYCDCGTFKKV